MINSLSLRYGLILGAIGLGVNVLLYLSGVNIMAMGIIGIVWLIVMLVLWIVFALRVRKANNNSFTLGEAFRSLFIIALISIVAGIVWQVLLINVIDPNYNAKMMEETMQLMDDMGVSMNDDMTGEMLAKMEESSSLTMQLKGMFINIAIMSVIALIVSLIIKKEGSSGSTLDTM